MPVPLPPPDKVNLDPSDAAEVDVIQGAITTAVTPPNGLTDLQYELIRANTFSLTGIDRDPRSGPPVSPEELAEQLRYRNEQWRTRIVQAMLLFEMVLVPIPTEVVEKVNAYARELDVDDAFLAVTRRYAEGSLGLALIDFERSGYEGTWTVEKTEFLHASRALQSAWEQAVTDADLAARWRALEHCPTGSMGRGVWQFYAARGFAFPGEPYSAPPYLAQHDWVHVLADYGSSPASEIEVFALISRAIEDPRGFSFLAMVIGLFETGYVPKAAGFFSADIGHLRHAGMAERLADAMVRGKAIAERCPGMSLMDLDWFAHADRPVEDVREDFGVPPKRADVEPISPGPFEPGGYTEFQLDMGKRIAAEEGRPYESFGATAYHVDDDVDGTPTEN